MGLRSIKSALGDGLRSTRARMAGSAIVLMYHRVADLASDPQRLAVGLEHFDQQMDILSRSYTVLTAGRLAESLARRRRIPERSVVVTFDDGYADTLLGAKPILSSHSVPATLFVSSDYLGGDTEFWWDEVERIALGPGHLPARLELEAGDARFRRDLETGSPSGEAGVRSPVAWDVTMEPVTERQRLYLALREFILPLSPAERASALESLRAQCGTGEAVRSSHRPLTEDELRELAAGDLVEIGAHTRSHALLASRTPDEQRDEIAGGKAALERVCGCGVRLLSYPYGDAGSFTEASMAIARDAGFLGAFSTRFGVVLPWTDRLRIPRCPTEDVGAPEFARRLEAWFDMARS
jgi:peptidoglycan/xylan/chitin deacetylase (PgdA/CDA1 family)